MSETNMRTIIIHEDACQGYTHLKFPICHEGKFIPYTEDFGTTFDVVFEKRKLTISVVCDGHSGYQTSCLVVDFIPTAFHSCLELALGDITNALSILFEKISFHVLRKSHVVAISGSTCNVTVFDPTKEKVYVACLGDSPTLRYSKDSTGNYYLAWMTKVQDCEDIEEIERMVQIHRQNGNKYASAEDVVYEVKMNGKPSGVWRNKRTHCMINSSFGDFQCEYYQGIVNTIPRIYSHDWTFDQLTDIWIQCTDGILEWLSDEKLGIKPCNDFRLKEIAKHLDQCCNSDNIARELHSSQVDSMLSERLKEHPGRADNTREWVENNFDNHLTKVFRWSK